MEHSSTQSFCASAVILAGGKSLRMGRDKARIKFGSETLLQHLVLRMAGLFEEIIIVAPDSGRNDRIPGTRRVTDIYTNAGPLGGIHSGICAASNSRIFVTACDMPFFNAVLAQLLLRRAEGYDAAVPCNGDFIEPLFAAYTKTALPKMEDYLRTGHTSVNAFLSSADTCKIPESTVRRYADPGKVFFNMNTPGDYRRIRSQMDEKLV